MAPLAVTQMLSLLMDHAGQGGAPPGGLLGSPMPAITSANLPAMTPPPANMPTQGQSLLGSLHDKLSGMMDSVRPNAPAGFEGILSPEDIKSARPSFLQSLIGSPDGPSSSDRYRSNLENIVKMHGLATQMAEHRRVMDARRAMADLFPSKPDETIDQTRNRLAQMYAYAMSHGDEETMKDVGSRLSSIFAAPHADTAGDRTPRTFTVDGKAVEGFSDKHGKFYNADGTPVTGHVTPYVPPKQEGEDRTIVQVEGPNGPMWVRREDAVGMLAKKSGMAGSAQNAASEALLRSSVSEMHNADNFMKEYENDLASGKKSINGLAQFMAGVGNSFTHDDPASRALQNTALTVLNHVNPDLARYIRRGLSFAEGEAGISKRPSDFRTKMAAFLSTASSGASPELIHDIQGRRSSILVPLTDVVSKMGTSATTSTPKGSGSATGAGLSFEDWKKAKGHK